MIDPTPAVIESGVAYSNCFFRCTSHQSIANIANATNLIVAHKPTYLHKKTKRKVNFQLLKVLSKMGDLLVSECFYVVN